MGIDTLHKLYAVLRQSWKAETAYKSCQNEWIASDPSYGSVCNHGNAGS